MDLIFKRRLVRHKLPIRLQIKVSKRNFNKPYQKERRKIARFIQIRKRIHLFFYNNLEEFFFFFKEYPLYIKAKVFRIFSTFDNKYSYWFEFFSTLSFPLPYPNSHTFSIGERESKLNFHALLMLNQPENVFRSRNEGMSETEVDKDF